MNNVCKTCGSDDPNKRLCSLIVQHHLGGRGGVPHEPNSMSCIECDNEAFHASSESRQAETREPLSARINALPEWARQYIHDIETRCDPAGDIRTITELRDTIRALTADAK